MDKKIPYYKILEKSREGVSDFFVYHIQRRLASGIVYIIQNYDISPNVITFLSFLFMILSSLLCFYEKFIMAGIFMFVADLFDCVDGTLARVKGKTSKLGKFLDGTLGDIGSLLVLSMFFYKVNIFLGFIFLLIVNIKNILKIYAPKDIMKENRKENLRIALSAWMVGFIVAIASFNKKFSAFLFIIYSLLSFLVNLRRAILSLT